MVEQPPAVTFDRVDGDQATAIVDELTELYREVYAEPPYEWGEEHAVLFRERYEGQRQAPGFRLVTARVGGELVGFTFGVTLRPSTPWWQNLTAPLPAEMTREWEGRTFAVVELLVRAAWRQQGIGKRLHDLLLEGRCEERATLTVLPTAEVAQAAYDRWGWRVVGLKRNPLPGAPVFEVRVKAG